MNKSLAPAITVTNSVPLKLPPVRDRWVVICVCTGVAVMPMVARKNGAFCNATLCGPTGLVTRAPPWA